MATRRALQVVSLLNFVHERMGQLNRRTDRPLVETVRNVPAFVFIRVWNQWRITRLHSIVYIQAISSQSTGTLEKWIAEAYTTLQKVENRSARHTNINDNQELGIRNKDQSTLWPWIICLHIHLPLIKEKRYGYINENWHYSFRTGAAWQTTRQSKARNNSIWHTGNFNCLGNITRLDWHLSAKFSSQWLDENLIQRRIYNLQWYPQQTSQQ